MKRKRHLREGWQQAMAAILLLIAAAVVIAVSTWSQSQTAGRLAAAGVVLFVIALLLGSGRLVAITSLPVLIAGLITLVGQENPAWIRGMVVGLLWYVAAELAWDAIERRDGVRRTVAHNHRRTDEVSKVVLMSLSVSAVAILISGTAPVRSMLVLATVLVALAASLATMAQVSRRFGTDQPNATESVSE